MRFKSETRSSNPVKPALVTIATKMKTRCSKLSDTTITNIRLLGKITSIQTCGSVCLGSHHLISSSYYYCVLVGDRRQHNFILLGWPTWLRQSLVRGTFLHIRHFDMARLFHSVSSTITVSYKLISQSDCQQRQDFSLLWWFNLQHPKYSLSEVVSSLLRTW